MAKQMSHSDPDKYTNPELRDQIKKEVTEGDKGGKPGQWSARKAQLVAAEYERKGGGFKGKLDEQQQSLHTWGEEKWHTSDGRPAEREGGTTRYLPDEAWKELSPSEKAATNRKKREGSREGKQFVANTAEAAKARKKATAKKRPAKASGSAAKKSAEGKSAAKKSVAKSTSAKGGEASGKAAAKKTSSSTAKKPRAAKKG